MKKGTCSSTLPLFIVLGFLFIIPPSTLSKTVLIRTEPALPPPAVYGIQHLEKVLKDKEFTVQRTTGNASGKGDYQIIAVIAPSPSGKIPALKTMDIHCPQKPESLVIQKKVLDGIETVVLCGSDARGLMYAALDSADRIEWNQDKDDPFHEVHSTRETPYIAERAVSIYTMQRRYFESRLYDEHYWQAYFDMLAKNRINSFVVIFGYENGGFMAPIYPYFFDVEGYPEVQLYGMTPDQQRRNSDALKTMIRLAHERGIDFTVGIWDHIYRGGVQSGGIAGASEKAGQRTPHLVYGVTADNLISYTKAALQKFLHVFPEVDAYQFRMHPESGLKRSEMPGFWHDIFAMIKKTQPDLKVDLRAKQLPDNIIEDGINQGIHLRIATKYWMEQMGLPFHPTHVNPPNQHDRRHGYADLLRYPQPYKVHWRLWNGGTTRLLLWGDPEYVRRFAESATVYQGDSFEVNEMLATKMLGEPHDAQPFELLQPPYRFYQYEFERYWHYYQVWGRVGYNPDVSPAIWEHEFQNRFGTETGIHLMKGLHLASGVLPRIVASSYRYRFFPTTRGWAEMMRISDLPDYAKAEGSDVQQFQNVQDAAGDLLNNRDTAMRTPDENSRWFKKRAADILECVEKAERVNGKKETSEYLSTLTDLKILANLALYHARRIPAGVAYNLYQQTGDLFALEHALAQERSAIDAWKQIVEAAAEVYNERMVFGVHRVGFPYHWKEELAKLEAGYEKLEKEKQQALKQASTKPLSFAHIPVRKVSPDEDLVLQLTVFGPPDSSRQIQAVLPNDEEHMLSGTGSMYEVRIKNRRGKKDLAYYFKTTDEHGRKTFYPGESVPHPITVTVTDDWAPPVVTLQRPVPAQPYVDYVVWVSVDDPSGVEWVRLRYRHLTQFEDYEILEMRYDPTRKKYTATIPGDFIVPQWDLMYFIEVMDSKHNGRMYPDLESDMPYVIVPLDR